MQAMEELGHFQLPGIVHRSERHGTVHCLKHEMMAADNGPQDPVMVSLCIQIAIDKMHFGSLSIGYACPCQNPTSTIGHFVHNVDICKPLSYATPYTLSAICPVQLKP
ncbi:hypothetical protein AAFF_G00319680 [Aldrovandia affinis]|uniref:Uncharacterized protein n=1 Tax=Aldrovandia affinis TaxID=143900 RepID=A0AAD7WQN9_9TELE|nr:hypothetical protein AAFF_G00319680 [Aldrovandia affinis]